MAFTTELTADTRITVGEAVISLCRDNLTKRVRIQIEAPKEVKILKEKIAENS